MKKEILFTLLLFIALSAVAQQLIIGSHDVVRLGEYPQDAYLVEADATSFFRVSGGYSTSTDHPLLGAALDPAFRSIYFIKYDKEGLPLKSNFIRGTNNVIFAGSFRGGFTLMSDAVEQVDASGQVIPIPDASEVEFIASYDPDCQLERIRNIWALTDNQYVESDAVMDPSDGSVYLFGKATVPLELIDFGTLAKDLDTPNSYLYLIKYDRNLDLQWVYQAGFDVTQSGTSPYFDKIQVFPGNNGMVLISGTYGTESSPLINGVSLPPYTDGYGTFAVMLDRDSQVQWVLDGLLKDYGYASRLFKGFPMDNGDFVLAGNTNTGYYKLGEAEFSFANSSLNNQFVFRIDPAGKPLWTRQFDSQGPVEEGKKKGVLSRVLDDNIFYDAICWKGRLLYLTAPFSNASFSIAGASMNLTHPEGIYIAAIDLRSGSELWGYALSSEDASIFGFDADRSGNLSLMGSNFATQDLDGIAGTAVVPGNFIFHVGLDYNGKALWYNNASLVNPPYADLRGVDLEVLPNGEVFTSLKLSSTNDIQIGGSQIGESEYSNSSWLVELASDIKLGGRVTDASDNPVYPGIVKAIKSAWWSAYPEMDTAFLKEDGTYLFDGLYPGNYALLAVPDRETYPEGVPSYYGDQIAWEGASFIDIYPGFNSNIVDIDLLEVPLLSPGDGSARLSGTINSDTEDGDVLKGTLARPAKKASVVLLKKTKKSTMAGDELAYVETDENGMFSFSNVPDGDYWLHVEVPGLEMLEIYELSISGAQVVSGLTYTVGDDGIYIGYPTAVSLLENKTLQIYPNPGSGRIYMDLPAAGEYQVTIFATDGRKVHQEAFNSEGGARSMDISGESNGMYIIRLTGPGTDETLKYLKR